MRPTRPLSVKIWWGGLGGVGGGGGGFLITVQFPHFSNLCCAVLCCGYGGRATGLMQQGSFEEEVVGGLEAPWIVLDMRCRSTNQIGVITTRPNPRTRRPKAFVADLAQSLWHGSQQCQSCFCPAVASHGCLIDTSLLRPCQPHLSDEEGSPPPNPPDTIRHDTTQQHSTQHNTTQHKTGRKNGFVWPWSQC